MEIPKVVAVTVNWNRAEDTLACVRSLKQQSHPLEKIIVVENGSVEEPSFYSRNPYHDLEIIENDANLGFGAGANIGIRHALSLGADFVLVINNDTIADPTMLEALIQQSQLQKIDISAPLIFYYELSDQVWSSGGDFCPLIGLPKDAHNRKNAPHETTKRSFLTGCCLLFNRSVIEKVGYFDEDYFMYYEDLDYMARARKQGLSIAIVPSAKLWHKEAQSSGGYLNPKERYWSARSLMRYSKRATTWWNAIPLWIHRGISMILWTIRLLPKAKKDALKAYWRGIHDGLGTELITNKLR